MESSLWKWRNGLAVLLAVLLAVMWRRNKPSPPVIWVVTPDSAGLHHDALIFERFLESSQTALVSQAPPSLANHDHPCVYLFLEVSPVNLPSYAHPKWKHDTQQQKCRVALMVNTDQFTNNLLTTPHLELILCKTRQCVSWVNQAQRDYRELTTNTQSPQIPICYIGFTSLIPSTVSQDDDDNSNDGDMSSRLARFDKFLHVAGKSPHKGTMSIVHAWMQHPEWPTLTLTSFHNPVVNALFENLQQEALPPNVQHVHHKLDKTQMDTILQNHGVHLSISGMEGFGHVINEGRAVGALVVTTDYPAMNELVNDTTGILVPPTRLIAWQNGLMYAHVDTHGMEDAINKILSTSLRQRADIGARAQRAFLQDKVEFAQRAQQVDCYLVKCPSRMVDLEESRKCAENICGLLLE